MTTPFTYSTTYTLDKSHFSETYDETAVKKNGLKRYGISLVLLGLGIASVQSPTINPYLAWFIIILGGVDLCSVYFAKPWWLARQMISEAANTRLNLNIDEHAISSESAAVSSKLLWQDIEKIERTQRGWLFYHSGGRNYLSARCLSDEANHYITARAASLNRVG